MKQGKICGVRSFTSKGGNECKIAFYTYTDDKDKSLVGCKSDMAFLDDDVLKAVGNKNILGCTCEIGGFYDKNGNWHNAIRSIKA